MVSATTSLPLAMESTDVGWRYAMGGRHENEHELAAAELELELVDSLIFHKKQLQNFSKSVF